MKIKIPNDVERVFKDGDGCTWLRIVYFCKRSGKYYDELTEHNSYSAKEISHERLKEIEANYQMALENLRNQIQYNF